MSLKFQLANIKTFCLSGYPGRNVIKSSISILFPREDVKIKLEIGRGKFGVVSLGKWGGEGNMVAVKVRCSFIINSLISHST